MKEFCRICHAELSAPLLTMENVPAAAQNLPASPDELAADRPVDLKICECPRCGVVQHTAAAVGYFREVLRASGVSEAMKRFRLTQFRSWLERFDLVGKPVFEAGCGNGEYLSLMAQAGAKVTGVEYGVSAVERCREQGLMAERNYFEQGTEVVGDGRFAGFFVLNFLEHIPDIPRFLDGCRNNLLPGGAGLIEVPNFDMILKNSLLTEFSTEHLYYFTAETLTNLLNNNGFEVRSISTVWSDYIISAEVVRQNGVDLSGCGATACRIRKELSDFISRHRKCAIWGVGHQALTTLALAGITQKEIAFAVDSSPAKQGRFTYATHIPIYAPDAVVSCGADAVLVACGGYSDEVAAVIREKYGQDIALAILREHGLEIL